MRARGGLVLAAWLTAFLATPVWSGDLAGVALPEQMMAGEITLVLNGMGLRKVTWFKLEAYVAGLYLEEKSSDAAGILGGGGAMQIILVFVRPVGRKRIIKEWDECLRANVGNDFAILEDRVAALRGWLPDAVESRDRMSFTYLPEKGVVVEIQGEIMGTIPGADFARALFAMWLGDHPPNEALKSGLLGRR